MPRDLTENTQKLPSLLVRACKLLWRTRVFFWLTVVLGIAVSAFSTWLFTADNTDFAHMPVGWAFQNRNILLFAGLILILLYVIAYLGSRFPTGLSEKEIRQLYFLVLVLSMAITGKTKNPLG